MVRRRAPPKRPSSSAANAASSLRKISGGDSRRFISNPGAGPGHHVLGLAETDVGGLLRTLLLGALVGGVLCFLFYPDISSLVNSWQPPSSPVARDAADGGGGGGGGGPLSSSQSQPPPAAAEPRNKNEPGRSSKVAGNGAGGGVSETKNSKAESSSTTKDKPAARGSAEEEEENNSNSNNSGGGGGGGVGGGNGSSAKKAKVPKRPAAKPTRRREEEEEATTFTTVDGCVCQQQRRREPVRQPSCGGQPPAAEAKPEPTKKKNNNKANKKKKAAPEPEEEVIEEEDSVEVELMEEEELWEPVQYIDLKAEEDEDEEEPEGSPDPAAENKEGASSRRDAAGRPENDAAPFSSSEPLVLRDGQTVSFTPISQGDENVISVGGRPKAKATAGGETSGSGAHKVTSDAKSNRPKAATPSDNNNNNKTPSRGTSPQASETQASTSSVRTEEEKDRTQEKSKAWDKMAASGKTTTGKTTAKNSKDSKKKEKKSSQSTAKQSQTGLGEGLDDPDLPEEVRNFKPTFLKTVAAKKIFADGRRIPPIELLPQKNTNSSVKVYLFNDFLSEAECDGLRRVHDKHVQGMSSQPLLCFDSISTLRKHIDDVSPNVHVTPNDFVKGTKCLNASFSGQLGMWMSGNWSYSTAFYPGESRFSDIFASRVERAMGLDPANGGKFQITSYPQGKAYKAHTDCMLSGTDPRDRVATVLVYLDDVDDGGETKFPELDIWVKPRKGRALVWNNMSPQGHCEPHSLHVASKVNSGSKYILIRWYYYKSFYSLGKRPYEPDLPRRSPGTPRVSCDDYDNGSCRWYDEWNNDHLLDYEYKKYKLI